jgi:ubiquitin-like modifier-activating enzyme ATG7
MLKFESVESGVDGTFWERLSSNKMQVYKLDDSFIPIQGSYKPGSLLVTNNGEKLAIPGRISVSSESFTKMNQFQVPGILKNTNTLGEFKELDKNLFLKEAGIKIWDAIVSGEAIKNPQVLNYFTLITFADLKKYKFFYWFAFPAIVPKTPFTHSNLHLIGSSYTSEQQVEIRHNFTNSRQSSLNKPDSFYLNRINLRF